MDPNCNSASRKNDSNDDETIEVEREKRNMPIAPQI